MKILHPHKISTEILDLIYEAKQYLIIVSPYVNFKYWERLASELVNAKNRGVRIDFFVRNEPENAASWEAVESLGLTPRLINNLHAKFYFNETKGVISSMNLLSSSNANSIEIGCKLENAEELEELKRFVKDFITTNETKVKPDGDDLYISKEKFTVVLEGFLSNNLNRGSRAYFKNNSITIQVGSNQFFLTVDKVENKVYLDAIVSHLEAEIYTKEAAKYFESGYLDHTLIDSSGGSYNRISGNSKTRLSNSYLDNLRVNEKKDLIVGIATFIDSVRNLKNDCYENEKARKAKEKDTVK